MLAARLPGLLPPLDNAAAKEAAAVLSLVGEFRPQSFGQRNFRQPHHSASAVALVGGGNPPRPGEISLAHKGILFLDELPEFDRKVLETLREPLESGRVHIARAARHAEFPAEFQLIAAMNPCPCGHHGSSDGKCRCTPDQVARYRGRLSGPFLDRIDLLIEVPALPADTLGNKADGESSASVRQRVSAALERQLQRNAGKTNARLTAGEIDRFCPPDAAGNRLLQQATAQLGLSARAWHRILKVARTIADLAGSDDIAAPHIAEAIHYRRLARV
jgi:magnesium chelatase family protein